jgi:hypothetical protein
VRRLVLLLLLPVLGVLAACQAKATVAVDVQPDGAGTVTVTVALDKEATTRLGDPAAALSTSDLADAGWRVSAPVTKAGAATFKVVRPYGSPDELAAVLDGMLQLPTHATILHNSVIGPLAEQQASKKIDASRKAAATKVDFFTLVRGDG